MERSADADDFVAAGLAALGIEADETEMAVIAAVHQLFWPPIQDLLALELDGLEPERFPDLSQAPR